MKKILSKPLVQMHIAVFLWGFTAILGKLFSMNALILVFIRMSLAAIGFYVFSETRKNIGSLSKKQLWFLICIGVIICIHWLCFYHAIKVFNSSSIALICLGTSSMFVIWIEYFLKIRKKLSWSDIIISLVAIIGLLLIYHGTDVANVDLINYKFAIFFGTMASLLAAIFTIMNKKASENISPYVISFVEMISGATLMFLIVSSLNLTTTILSISSMDWIWILVLSIFCTIIPFLLSVFALKKLDAFTVTLSVNLEPIYGMIFAAIFFHEFNAFNHYFFIGSFLILISVFLPMFGKIITNKIVT